MPSEEQSSDVFNDIDENLRRAYEELLNEELPDRFKQLIQKLKDESGAVEIAGASSEGTTDA